MAMDTMLQIAWNNVDHMPEVEETIRTCADRLERHADRMTNLRVVVGLPHRHQRTGNGYDIRIDVGLKGSEFVVKRGDERSSDDPVVAVRNAFDIVRRKLDEDHRRVIDAHRTGGDQ